MDKFNNELYGYESNNTEGVHHDETGIQDVIYEELKQESVKESTEKRRFSFKQIVILFLIISLVGGTSIGAGFSIASNLMEGNKYHLADNHNVKHNNKFDKNFVVNLQDSYVNSPIVNIAKEVGPSVVAITTKVRISDWFRNEYIQEANGSGVIFDVNDKNILILTNNHVIEDAQELIVTLNGNVKVPAVVMGKDRETDLAIVKIEKKDVPEDVYKKVRPAVFGDSDLLRVGEPAIAIGNPLGYNNTVTVGVISALNRELNLPDKRLRLIQTDAAINPGNSGGALVNIKGEVIGINTIKIADTKVEGIGFAIPINHAKPIIEELVNKGYVSRPFLGILGRDVDEHLSELYEIPIGVIVVDVIENGAADRAGIKRGDVIIEFDGKKIVSMEQLSDLIRKYEVGKKVKVKIVRNGKEKKEITVKLQEKISR
ncbi:serine protease Do [Caminicella sporogenes DSM 14501]|uniref:Serine protease Do n=1 Tax=Caminicella sporogenes DSM 14501 TaxID=1121266 RepID=A0A1M6NM23_9FIRM|nr:trypsin-like peptidase domain-containing protein [Caminicella sporogenes]RKD22160.1 hypothetical protein BET04_05925 [Caminicella sporogenes]SHJ96602.1 serine protease Do [Caminicella sporogenes DSM 14501]